MTTRLNKNFTHFIGDELILEYTFSQVNELRIGVSGITQEINSISWILKNTEGVTILTKTNVSGITIGEVTVGGESLFVLAKVELLPSDTINLPIGVYTYQLMVTDTADRPITCAEGDMALRKTFRSI